NLLEVDHHLAFTSDGEIEIGAVAAQRHKVSARADRSNVRNVGDRGTQDDFEGAAICVEEHAITVISVPVGDGRNGLATQIVEVEGKGAERSGLCSGLYGDDIAGNTEAKRG